MRLQIDFIWVFIFRALPHSLRTQEEGGAKEDIEDE